MKRHTAFWTAIAVVGAAILFGGGHLGGGLLLLFALMHSGQLGWRAVLLTLVTLVCWAGLWQLSLPSASFAEARSGQASVLVYPSRLKVNGDLLTGRVQDIESEKMVWWQYKLSSAVEKQSLLAQNQPFIISGLVERSALTSRRNPGTFDFQQFAHYQYHIHTRWQMTGGTIQTTPTPSWRTWFSFVGERWRQVLRRRIDTLPPHLRIYVQGLLLGGQDHSVLAKTLQADQTKLGIIHLWSLSGMQVMLLGTALLCLLSIGRCPYEVARYVVIGLLLAYGLLTDWPTGVTRSVAMFGLAHGLPARWSLGPLDRMGVVFIWWSLGRPLGVLLLGNILSFFLAFCLYYAPAQFWRQSLWINLLSLPFVVYFQYQWSPFTLLLNIALIPLFNFVVFPLVFLVTILALIGMPGWRMLEIGLTGLDQHLAWWAQLPGAFWTIGMIPGMMLGVLIICSLLIAFVPRWRLAALGVFGTLLVGLTIWRQWPLQDRVAFIDVGQGDSSLVIARGSGPRVLIDTGGQLQFTRPKWQTRYYSPPIDYHVLPVLRYWGIGRLDAVFISHQDADHMGNLGDLLQQVAVNQIFVPSGMQEHEGLCAAVTRARQKPAVIPLTAGQNVTIRGMTFYVVHPFQAGSGTNEDSLVVQTQLQHHNLLWLGDLDTAGEERIMQHFSLTADIIKLGHHGSKTSTGDALLQTLKPQIGIISAGQNNRYHHPAPTTVERLRHNQVTALNTAEQGYIEYVAPIFGEPYWHTMRQWRQKQWMLKHYSKN
ncbi:DNA internalization-related competence protein ComEC/Rec2 [Schleiferilactobacillus perolens]|uniref:DNA internalization-related competence protein ComEC/Rec2 n=1 Tax=Schleiferilactobacillus perolens TaxID=100468 RepID=UPI0039E8E16C